MIEQLVSRNRYSSRPENNLHSLLKADAEKGAASTQQISSPFCSSALRSSSRRSFVRFSFEFSAYTGIILVCLHFSEQTHTQNALKYGNTFFVRKEKHLQSSRSGDRGGDGGREKQRNVAASRNSESFDLDRIPFHMGFITKLSVSSIKIETTATFRGTNRSRIGIYFSEALCERKDNRECENSLESFDKNESWNFFRPQTRGLSITFALPPPQLPLPLPSSIEMRIRETRFLYRSRN